MHVGPNKGFFCPSWSSVLISPHTVPSDLDLADLTLDQDILVRA